MHKETIEAYWSMCRYSGRDSRQLAHWYEFLKFLYRLADKPEKMD